MASFWSAQLEQALTGLLAEPYLDDPWVQAQAKELRAVPVIWSMWVFCFLRPNGEVVVADSEFGGPLRVVDDRGIVLQMLA